MARECCAKIWASTVGKSIDGPSANGKFEATLNGSTANCLDELLGAAHARVLLWKAVACLVWKVLLLGLGLQPVLAGRFEHFDPINWWRAIDLLPFGREPEVAFPLKILLGLAIYV